MVKVLKPGFYSTIQDLGRYGYQDFGVPYSGVMDSYSASLANVILGNDENAAVLEMTMTGTTLEFCCDTYISICGADMVPKINDLQIANNRVVKVDKGDILSFGKLSFGFRSYLAVLGGFNTENIMNSHSMYSGITEQFVILKNDELQIKTSSVKLDKKHASIKTKRSHFTAEAIEVYKGPEFELLSKAQQNLLISKKFTISKDNNRMAYQLEDPIENSLPSIITSAVLPGTVQLTPSGKLIILMRDCQTTGGYPRVLQLKETSINKLAQKFTNNTITFKFISEY